MAPQNKYTDIDLLCDLLDASFDRIRYEKRWMFAITVAMLLAILALVIRLSI